MKRPRPRQRLCCDEDQCETRRGFRDAQGPDYLGRRPEAIQVAPLIRGIERSSHCTSVVAVTGNTEKCSIRSRANCHCALSPWRHCRGTCGSRWGPETAPLCTRRSHHMADVRGVESRCGTGNAQARLASATVADGRRNSLPKVITAIAPTWPASFGTQQQVQPNC